MPNESAGHAILRLERENHRLRELLRQVVEHDWHTGWSADARAAIASGRARGAATGA